MATVEGREVVELRSGRTVWRDPHREEWGGFIAGLRPWHVLATLTYDHGKRERRQLKMRRSLDAPDVKRWMELPARNEIVSMDVTQGDFRRWIRQCEGRLQGRIEYVDAVEFQKSGWPHHHGVLSLPEGLHYGDFNAMYGLWFKRNGFVKLEVPRSIADVCEYASKYLAKELDRGAVLLSDKLKDVTAQRRLMQRWR